MVHIFITGASGFVGGDALYAVITEHPTYTFSALVRSDSSAKEISDKYPAIKIVRGDLDDVKTVEEEAQQSDLVLNLASTNHFASVKAIVSGLASRENGGTLLQMGGVSILGYAELSSGTYGEPSSNKFDDIKDISIIRELCATHPSRPVDTYLLTLSNPKVKTAVVCGPCIYGVGRGPGNTKSMQIPDLAVAALKAGEGVMPGKGESRWSMVHVSDISAVFSGLVGKALVAGKGTEEHDVGAWDSEGYYFPSTSEKSWGEICELVAKEAYKEKLIKSEGVRSIDKKEMDGLVGNSALFGISARVFGQRAEKVFGWKEKGPTVEEEVVRVVREEGKLV